ncbi:winged helix-turn-helix domain-containing protein [Methanobrevibacter sp. OttesenSCG-928-I08]|nr:winged helix-turn-helix domain-containing protein [Methanobrevibacter sp. OttesenSCG-928-I08]
MSNESFQNEFEIYNQEQELFEIKKMIKLMNIELKNVVEQTNQNHMNLINSLVKNDFISSINKHTLDNSPQMLDKGLIKNCELREGCKKTFQNYIKKHIGDLNPEDVSDEKINNIKEELKDMKNAACQREHSDICFNSLFDIVTNQMSLVKSLKTSKNTEASVDILAIDEEFVVNEYLDPIANKQRLNILKSIAIEPKTFSKLSQITKLRGGNLLFHINKLQDANLIIQKHERGEYVLSKKGFKLIGLVSSLEK